MSDSFTPSGVHRSAVVALFTAKVISDAIPVSSPSMDCSQYTRFLLSVQVLSKGTPTDIRLVVEFSDDGGKTWYIYKEGIFVSLYYEDQDTVAPGIKDKFKGDVTGRLMRLSAVASGCSAGNTFTLSASIELLQ